MKRYVGLDVHSKSTVYVVQDETGRVMGRGAVETTPSGLGDLREKMALEDGTEVGLETGTMAFYVARLLGRMGLRPVVIDAHEVRLKAHRPMQKSDRRDAFEICDGLRRGIYRSIVHVPPPAVEALRETLSRRRHFVGARTSEVNAVKRLLRSVGLRQLARSLRTEAGWKKLFGSLEKEPEMRAYVEVHHAVWRSAGEQIARLEEMLEEQQRPFEVQVRSLQTVPGVGPVVALTTVAVFSDVKRFPSAKHAASYGGLVPSTNQSGDRDGHGHITKRGSAELRAMLCEAAHHARRPEHPLHPYFAKLCARRGYKMATVAVAHRLCRILFGMLRTGRDFDVGRLGVERGPFVAESVRTFRLKPKSEKRAAGAHA